jgi:hypothetical protein
VSARLVTIAVAWLVIGCTGERREDEPQGVPSEPAAAPASSAPTPAVAAKPGAPGTIETPSLPATRYAVCGREEAPARLYPLSWHVPGAALWAVSCGSTTHVIAIEAEQGVVIARRIARLSLPSPAPDRAPRPAPIALLESEGAWLVSTLRVDRNGSPAGGALFRAPLAGDAQGTSRVHDASPGALVLATLDRTPGQDFALLQLGDARVAQAAELWLFSGGPLPQRIARRSVEPGAEQLAAIDLDADGSDEIAVLTPGAVGRVTVHALNDQAPALAADVPGSDGLYALDLDGDGKREIVTSGPTARRLSLSGNSQETSSRQLTATPIAELDGLRDLRELDVDADGRAEITGYAHPQVVAVTPKRAETLGKRSVLFELRGERFSVLEAVPTHLDGDGRIDLLALITSESGDPQVELLLSIRPEGSDKSLGLVRAPTDTRQLRNAPLTRELELR